MTQVNQQKKNGQTYEIRGGKLYFEEKEVCANGAYPFTNLVFESFLGEGANGITFFAKHAVLKNNQVVKISKTGVEKAILEARKNANTEISESIVVISDAGELDFPTDTSYSIMPMVDDSVTLRQWLEARDILLTYFTHKDSAYNIRDRTGTNVVCQLSLNVGSALLYSYAKLIKHNIVHGDLNPGNILINDGVIDSEILNTLLSLKRRGEELDHHSEEKVRKFLEEVDNFIHCLNQKLVNVTLGVIDSSRIRIKLIDLGSSQIEGTNIFIGEMRDNYFLIDSLRKILKPFFPNSSLIKYLNISDSEFRNEKKVKFDIQDNYLEEFLELLPPMPYSPIKPEQLREESELPTPYRVSLAHAGKITYIQCIRCWEWVFRGLVAGDLLRLITFLNVIYGYYSNGGLIPLYRNYVNELNSYINYRNGTNLLDINVFQSSHMEAWELLIYSNNSCSAGDLVNWDKLWCDLSKFGKSDDYPYTIFDYIELKDGDVKVTDSGKEKWKEIVKNSDTLLP